MQTILRFTRLATAAHTHTHDHDIGELGDFLLHSFIDTIKVVPFLFITYLIIEYFEHRATDKLLHKLQRSSRFGPLIGSIAGLFPQCGFSAIASNFYVNRFITLGTLIAIFLATSDEMIPVLLTIDPALIPPILGIKLAVGLIAGFSIDFFLRRVFRRDHDQPRTGAICEQEQCHCDKDHGILRPALHHTLRITLYIFLATLALNVLLHFVDIAHYFSAEPLLGVIIAAILGLIPNCATSIIITKLYATGSISFGIMMAGLLTNSGVGLLVLARINRNLRENFAIVGVLLVVAVLSGLLIDAVV